MGSALIKHAASPVPQDLKPPGWHAHQNAFWGRVRVAVTSSTGLFFQGWFLHFAGDTQASLLWKKKKKK